MQGMGEANDGSGRSRGSSEVRAQGGRDRRQYMLWAFKLRGCVDCDYRPETIDDLKRMHCDHRDPSTKKHYHDHSLTPGGAGGLRNSSSAVLLLEELWKCDPVCEDCHKKRTRSRGRVDVGQVSLPLLEWIAEPVLPIEVGQQVTIHEGHQSGSGAGLQGQR